MIDPFYQDATITLYLGDAIEVLPELPRAAAVITDPPYGVTHLEWDQWPAGWVEAAGAVTDQMWCFGSFRMFMDRRDEFESWKLAQEIVWEKHNGSNNSADRFRRVHELAVHFYRGEWASLHKEPQFTNDATARQVRRKKRPPQWGEIGEGVYTSEDGGPRHARSVMYVRSCHGSAENETQKPTAIVAPLLLYSVPPDGLVIDPFAGSGTTLVVARNHGRRAIGIEKRQEQCDVIVARLSQQSLPFARGGA